MREQPPESGTVELRSGAWSWHARRAEAGTTITYHHMQRGQGEMRSWTPARTLTTDEVLALAREPVFRLWTDSIGLQWSVSVERTRTRRRGGDDPSVPAPQIRSLVFQRGGVRRHAVLEEGQYLGDLSRAELQTFFDSI